MLNIEEIRRHFVPLLQGPGFTEYLLKEYLQYKMLDILFNGKWTHNLSFIGGTALRIVHGIDRFSEDLDFDCFELERKDFKEMSDAVIARLNLEGIHCVADDKEKDGQLNAFRRNISFPGLLYDLKLSPHREKRFLIKIEAQAHHYDYRCENPLIQKFNIFTQIRTVPLPLLLSMKLAAMIERQKGRDYYDCIFLMGKSKPDYGYLSEKMGIHSPDELKATILQSIDSIDFNHKIRDFQRLVHHPANAEKIRFFANYIQSYKF
jgi:predicted nucleotidyltransferase component of viral defense system